jgi:hypothetical protein
MHYAAVRGSDVACSTIAIQSFHCVAQEVMGEGEHRDVVARLLSKISSLQAAAASAEATRRALHNQMVELRGNVSDV